MTITLHKYHIGELWAKYQNDLQKGIDKPYIKLGDLVEVRQYDDLIHNGNIITEHDKNTKLPYAGDCLRVITSDKVGADLWYHTCLGVYGEHVVLTDADIEWVCRYEDINQ